MWSEFQFNCWAISNPSYKRYYSLVDNDEKIKQRRNKKRFEESERRRKEREISNKNNLLLFGYFNNERTILKKCSTNSDAGR